MIQDLGISTSSRAEETGFWRRQFRPPRTRAQRVFDVLFGIIAPVLCFAFDPIVLKRGEFGGALFPQFRSFVYLVSGIEILLLITWMALGRELRPNTRLIGGTLIAGALFSGLIGLALLPLTLIGLLVVIGIFGFIPFLTALVYLRNGRNALEQSYSGGSVWVRSVVAGCILALAPAAGLSLVAGTFVSDSMNAVIYANAATADTAIEQIKYLQFLAAPETDQLVVAYAAENDPERKKELGRRYLKLTGQDIEERQRILAD